MRAPGSTRCGGPAASPVGACEGRWGGPATRLESRGSAGAAAGTRVPTADRTNDQKSLRDRGPRSRARCRTGGRFLRRRAQRGDRGCSAQTGPGHDQIGLSAVGRDADQTPQGGASATPSPSRRSCATGTAATNGAAFFRVATRLARRSERASVPAARPGRSPGRSGWASRRSPPDRPARDSNLGWTTVACPGPRPGTSGSVGRWPTSP